MGFYKSKLNTYSKFIRFNPEEMAHTQRRIISAKEKSLEQAKEDVRLARKFHIEDSKTETEEHLYLRSKEIAFIKTLDVVDFYQYLINVENYHLVEMLNESANKKNEYDNEIAKISGSKNKIVAGVANRKIEKLTNASNKEGLTVGCLAETMAEWKDLIPDDQVIYIIGRYEMERKSDFDKEGFEDYKDTVYSPAQNKDEAVESEKQ